MNDVYEPPLAVRVAREHETERVAVELPKPGRRPDRRQNLRRDAAALDFEALARSGHGCSFEVTARRPAARPASWPWPSRT